MRTHFTGQVAVVTGGSRGIGLATVRALRDAGADVVAGARDPSPLRGLDGVVPVPVDLVNPAGPAQLVERALATAGRVDVLVNNVGGVEPRLGGFLSITDEDWTACLELNLLTAVRACRAVLPHMVERGSGAVVNVSSVNARQPAPLVADYAAAKAALSNLTRALAEEFTPKGIRVNAVSPGPVRTSLWEAPGRFGEQVAAASGTDLATLLEKMPEHRGLTVGRLIEAEEVAAMVVHLASDMAGSVTGSDWLIDAGMVKAL